MTIQWLKLALLTTKLPTTATPLEGTLVPPHAATPAAVAMAAMHATAVLIFLVTSPADGSESRSTRLHLSR
jgi:hypothetical protein